MAGESKVARWCWEDGEMHEWHLSVWGKRGRRAELLIAACGIANNVILGAWCQCKPLKSSGCCCLPQMFAGRAETRGCARWEQDCASSGCACGQQEVTCGLSPVKT